MVVRKKEATRFCDSLSEVCVCASYRGCGCSLICLHLCLPQFLSVFSLPLSVPASVLAFPPSVPALPPHGSSARTGFPPPETRSSSPGPAGPGWLHLPPRAGRRRGATVTPDIPLPSLSWSPLLGLGEKHIAWEGWSWGLCLGGLPSTHSPLLHPTPPSL